MAAGPMTAAPHLRDSSVPLLSVLIPVYNERKTIEEVISRVEAVDLSKEIIVVDDASTDGTGEVLKEIAQAGRIQLVCHDKNRGKGAAVRTAIEKAQGVYLIVQDADLEYSPSEYPALLKPLLDGCADVVYGSRFLGPHRVFLFWHYFGNRFLTLLTNILYNTMLTDMETGHKAFRREVLQGIQIRSNSFDFEPEITAKIFKRAFRVYEIPVRYDGRSYEEGKKITCWDALPALWALVKYRFVD